MRNSFLAIVATLTLLIAALWATATFVNSGPRGRIIIATGGSHGAFHERGSVSQGHSGGKVE